MVDYSKFERIAAAQEQEEAAEAAGTRGAPRVTKLAQPSRVTIPAKQARAEPELLVESQAQTSTMEGASTLKVAPSKPSKPGLNYDKWDALAAEMDDDEAQEAEDNHKDYFEDDWRQKANDEQREREQQQQQQQQQQKEQRQQEKEAAPASSGLSKFSEGGAVETSHMWAQDRREVRLYVPVKGGTRAKDVKVELRESGRLSVSTAAQGCVLEEQLWHDVWGAVFTHPKPLGVTDAMEEDNEMQWEVVDLPIELHRGECTRCVAVTLVKQLPTDLLRSLWWKAAFARDGAGADAGVGASAGAGVGAGAGAGAGAVRAGVAAASTDLQQSTPAGQSFQAAWTEAQAAFKAKVQRERADEGQDQGQG